MKPSFLFWMACAIICLMSFPAAAQKTEVTATGSFVMGDLDSKQDARKIALLNAKQAALDKAGAYVSTLSEVQNYELTQDEVISLTSGMMSVEVLSENWSMQGTSPVVEITVRAEVELEDLDERIQGIKSDQDAVEDYARLLEEVDQLKSELAQLKNREADVKDETGTVEAVPEANPAVEIVVSDISQKERETIDKLLSADQVDDALVAMNKQEPAQAISHLSKARNNTVKDFRVYLLSAKAYEKLDRNYKALADLEKALNLAPENSGILALKGKILLKIGQSRQALDAYNKAIAVDSKCGDCYFGRAMVKKALGRLPDALKDFSAACRLGSFKGCEAASDIKARRHSSGTKTNRSVSPYSPSTPKPALHGPAPSRVPQRYP